MVRWIVIGILGCLALVVFSETGMTDEVLETRAEKGKCEVTSKSATQKGTARLPEWKPPPAG